MKYVAQRSRAFRCCHSRYSSTRACFFESLGYQWSASFFSRTKYLSMATDSVRTTPSSSMAGIFVNGFSLGNSPLRCSPEMTKLTSESGRYERREQRKEMILCAKLVAG